MSNTIQKTLDSLQPYVIGIRYLEGTVLVDAVFKEGWTVPEDSKIKAVKGDDGMNYYMLFSEVKGIGLDELLAYVAKVIKINLEREKKHELLRTKVNELKEIFKRNSLEKLNSLKFTFTEEDLVPKLEEFDLNIDEEPMIEPVIQEPIIEEPIYEEEVVIPTEPVSYLDENGKPFEMTDEDREMLEEEARAERNRQILEAKKQKQGVKTISKRVELPPKPQLEMAKTRNYVTDCECGEDEACEKCIDSKGY